MGQQMGRFLCTCGSELNAGLTGKAATFDAWDRGWEQLRDGSWRCLDCKIAWFNQAHPGYIEKHSHIVKAIECYREYDALHCR
jgi:hypothetical protein